jgi:hypothetical protein
MTTFSRRNFLRGAWHAPPSPVAGETLFPQAGQGASCALAALPPEFSPAMLRLEGRRLGLPVEAMHEEELARAVLRAMRAGARRASPAAAHNLRGGQDG